MTTRRTLLSTAAAFAALSFATPAIAQSTKPVPVVATFSVLGDMVGRIGGKHISLTTLVGPDGDAHVYAPTPADARAVSKAKVLFVNGLDFEGWIDRLVDASGFQGTRVVATTGIKAIPFEEGHEEEGHDDHDKHAHGEEKHGHDDHDKHDHDKHDNDKHEHGDDDHDKHAHAEEKHGHDKHDHDDHKGHHDHGDKHADSKPHDDHADEKHDDHHAGHDHGAFDPHAWQSIQNALVYVDNITAALAKADPANASAYYGNRAAYVTELKAVETDIRARMAALPEDKRTVVTSHDAFGYFSDAYKLKFEAPQGMSTESEASAADVAKLITQIRKEKISAVFVETITDNRLMEQISRETGAKIGGTLYSDALSGKNGPASTYLDMMRHNAKTLAGALGS